MSNVSPSSSSLQQPKLKVQGLLCLVVNRQHKKFVDFWAHGYGNIRLHLPFVIKGAVDSKGVPLQPTVPTAVSTWAVLIEGVLEKQPATYSSQKENIAYTLQCATGFEKPGSEHGIPKSYSANGTVEISDTVLVGGISSEGAMLYSRTLGRVYCPKRLYESVEDELEPGKPIKVNITKEKQPGELHCGNSYWRVTDRLKDKEVHEYWAKHADRVTAAFEKHFVRVTGTLDKVTDLGLRCPVLIMNAPELQKHGGSVSQVQFGFKDYNDFDNAHYLMERRGEEKITAWVGKLDLDFASKMGEKSVRPFCVSPDEVRPVRYVISSDDDDGWGADITVIDKRATGAAISQVTKPADSKETASATGVHARTKKQGLADKRRDQQEEEACRLLNRLLSIDNVFNTLLETDRACISEINDYLGQKRVANVAPTGSAAAAKSK